MMKMKKRMVCTHYLLLPTCCVLFHANAPLYRWLVVDQLVCWLCDTSDNGHGKLTTLPLHHSISLNGNV
jgi:hypothetical protein